MHQVEYVRTERGKLKACSAGFVYNFTSNKKNDPTVSFYRCEDYWKDWKCPARVNIIILY